MKTKRRSYTLLMILLCLAMVMPISALSDASAVAPRYQVVSKFEASLVISSNGFATCTGKSSVVPGYTADVTMELQQNKDGAWKTIKTWTDSGRIVSLCQNWYVASGYNYRVRVSADALSSSGEVIEKPEVFSAIQHY